MKITVNIPEEVLEKADNRCKQLGISRSAFITMTVSEKLMQTDVMDNVPKMLELMSKAVSEK